jgi:signal peptidase I
MTQDLPQMPSPEEPMDDNKRGKKSEGFKSVLSTLLIIVCAPLIALLLINFVFQSYEVDGPSMEKTLQNADRLIVWKLPRTIARVKGDHYIPARGDIIVFTKHGTVQDVGVGEKQLIKRVIGLPGDRVVVSNNEVIVYNEQNPSGFNPDTDAKHGDMVSPTTNDVDMTINEDEVFVLGDNRPNSLDSRVFGPVKSDDIVGKLEFRIFPFNKFEQF